VPIPLAEREVAADRDYETVYRAAITRDKDGNLSLIKLETAGRSAPVTAPSKSAEPAKPTGQPRVNPDSPLVTPLEIPR
jgi:hypothetical protein